MSMRPYYRRSLILHIIMARARAVTARLLEVIVAHFIANFTISYLGRDATMYVTARGFLSHSLLKSSIICFFITNFIQSFAKVKIL